MKILVIDKVFAIIRINSKPSRIQNSKWNINIKNKHKNVSPERKQREIGLKYYSAFVL